MSHDVITGGDLKEVLLTAAAVAEHLVGKPLAEVTVFMEDSDRVYRIVDSQGKVSCRVKDGTPRLADNLLSAKRMLSNAGRNSHRIEQGRVSWESLTD